ncbi:amidase [Fulvivirga ligni]|uniref:amidase n=1 Tax=Fulvivirga ligni TaxID=2904246 RepID=UPI001F40B64D|nr:amidase [Fulvivirga ligni]UII22546.1 amidase [Fulvivirga ligni]
MKNLILYSIIVSALLSCTVKSSSDDAQAVDTLAIIESVFDLKFDQAKRDSLKDGIKNNLKSIQSIHQYHLDNSISPALVFNPVPEGFKIDQNQKPINWDLPDNLTLPENKNDLAFYTVAELSTLIKRRLITSTELTTFFINRLKQYGDTLQCVITITEELAMEQAKKADEELAAGIYKGPLHGIPYGVKDLLALEGYKTTWGAMPFKDQNIDATATVIKKLEQAGGVLVAKLTLGALAMGDIWYGGKTKNPWDLNQGSSGSSAGSASATAAGLVPFAIGTETWGSIVSPSTRCGTTGLRPTFGRVSKYGAMALSWSMDKIGPICRSAKDCAIVFDAIRGVDELDRSTIGAAFNFNAGQNPKTLKVAYLKDLFQSSTFHKEIDSASVEVFKGMGIELHELSLSTKLPVDDLSLILSAESAAAFDELTRSGRDSLLVNQKKNAWPNYFRQGRFISAADYINANRIRHELIIEFNEMLNEYDAIITPSFGGDQLLMTNLTGNPCVVFPNGFDDEGHPGSLSIIGKLFGEAAILELANAYQSQTNSEDLHPEKFIN